MSALKILAAAAGLCLAVALPVGAHDAPKSVTTKPASPPATRSQPGAAEKAGPGDHDHGTQGAHDDEVHLDAAQIAAGNFAVEPAGKGVIGARITVPGTVVPSGDHIARVAVRLLGTVVELRKRLGDSVAAGEVVAVIESREVADAKSDYLAAQLAFGLQDTLFARAKRLFDGSVMTENDYLRARTTYEDSRIKRDLARQKLFALNLTSQQIDALPQQPQESLRLQELRAPIAGKVAERRAEIGGLVGREGQESELYVIVDLSSVWVELAVSPADLPRIRQGQDIGITAPGGKRMPAQIIFVSPLLDKDTRTARVVASFDNGKSTLHPGAFVTADIPAVDARQSVVVPQSAVQTVENKTAVFVQTGKGFATRPVVLGERDGGMAEVVSGLEAGEKVATANTFVLKADLGKSEAAHSH